METNALPLGLLIHAMIAEQLQLSAAGKVCYNSVE
jgi:hypothetical protein